MGLAARILHRLLEWLSVSLLLVLALVVTAAVFFRYALNDSLPWYDEFASVLLAWINHFGAALAAQKRAHMSFGAVVVGLPPGLRLVAFALSEAVTYVVFVTLAWAGWKVLAVMEGMTLESLPWASLQVVQGIIPVGCTLIVLAQAASTPQALARVRAGRDADAEEVEQEIERAQADLARHASKDRREMLIALVLLASLVLMVMISVPIAVAICAVSLGGLFVSRGTIGLFDGALKMYEGATRPRSSPSRCSCSPAR